MAKKYYVVWEGYDIGVYASWEEGKKNISGYPTAKYKSFPTKELAEKAFREGYQHYWGKKVDKPIMSSDYDHNSIAVDAACSGNPGTMYYRGVIAATKEIVFAQGPFPSATNNIGEFLAIVHALALLYKAKDTRVIYSDSQIAISWVKQKKCKTKLAQEENNKKIFELIERAENWLQTHTYSNPILKWETQLWGEIPADYGNKK